MKCPKCGNDMECVMYSDDTGDYIHWVCYVCEVGIDDSYGSFHPERFFLKGELDEVQFS